MQDEAARFAAYIPRLHAESAASHDEIPATTDAAWARMLDTRAAQGKRHHDFRFLRRLEMSKAYDDDGLCYSTFALALML